MCDVHPRDKKGEFLKKAFIEHHCIYVNMLIMLIMLIMSIMLILILVMNYDLIKYYNLIN